MINSIVGWVNILAVVIDRKWQPGIGDPSFLGWFTVLIYVLTALLCISCARKAEVGSKRYSLDDDTGDIYLPRQPSSKLKFFWAILSFIMLILAVNKQLDLQTWFTLTAKDLAKSGGWYAQRRMYQLAFIIAIASMMALLITTIAVAIRNYWHRVWLAIVGLGLLATFISIRAISFHHVDVILGLTLGGVRLNALLELAGISCIMLSTFRYLRWV